MTDHFNFKPVDTSEVSEFARKLIAHSTEFHKQRPDETLRTCVEIGMGRLQSEYPNAERVVQAALADIASRSIIFAE